MEQPEKAMFYESSAQERLSKFSVAYQMDENFWRAATSGSMGP
jgi:hypothetical protein